MKSNTYRPPYKQPKPIFIRPELLLHPNIPKPLHGLNPRTILGTEWWDEKRQEAYKKNNYCCWACGVHKLNAKYHSWLEAHEYYDYEYEKGEAKLIEIVALCHSCHNFIHSGRMNMLLDSGEMSIVMYLDIKHHGEFILEKAGLLVDYYNQTPPQKVAEWKAWHIVIGGKKYYTKFSGIEEWYLHYNG